MRAATTLICSVLTIGVGALASALSEYSRTRIHAEQVELRGAILPEADLTLANQRPLRGGACRRLSDSEFGPSSPAVATGPCAS
jgi:hypothetical protein